MPTYRRALTFLGAVCLAYLCSYVSLVLSASYPGLRFFGRYAFILAALCVVLLTFERGLRYRSLPGLFPMLAFTAYYLIHFIYFEPGQLETYGQGLLTVYSLAIGFRLLIRTEDDYRQILLINWIFLLAVLSYYIYFVRSFGPLVARITPEELGLEINGNILCLMTNAFNILSLRIYETYLPGNVKRSVNRQWLGVFGLSAISLACLIFTFWHLNWTYTALNLIIFGLIIHRFTGKSIKVGLIVVLAVVVTTIDLNLFDNGFADQFNMYSERVESGGSVEIRKVSARVVYDRWLINPIFGAAQSFAVPPVWEGSANHLFYLNILAIYGVVGFVLFAFLILSLILPGIRSMSMGQMLARVLFLTIWIVGPSTYPQAIALLIMLPREFYSNNNSRL